jgi:hypothetical protein
MHDETNSFYSINEKIPVCHRDGFFLTNRTMDHRRETKEELNMQESQHIQLFSVLIFIPGRDAYRLILLVDVSPVSTRSGMGQS